MLALAPLALAVATAFAGQALADDHLVSSHYTRAMQKRALSGNWEEDHKLELDSFVSLHRCRRRRTFPAFLSVAGTDSFAALAFTRT